MILPGLSSGPEENSDCVYLVLLSEEDEEHGNAVDSVRERRDVRPLVTVTSPTRERCLDLNFRSTSWCPITFSHPKFFKGGQTHTYQPSAGFMRE